MFESNSLTYFTTIICHDNLSQSKNVTPYDTPTLPQGMWRMMQQEEPEDFVLATGEVHSVREFVEAAFKEVQRRFPFQEVLQVSIVN